MSAALLRHGEGLCMHHKCICCWHDTWHMRISWRGMAQAHMCSAIIQLVALCHATPCHALPCGASCRPPMTPHCCPSLPPLPTALQVVAARTLMSEDLATWRCQGAPRAEEILWGNLGFRVWERTGGPVWASAHCTCRVSIAEHESRNGTVVRPPDAANGLRCPATPGAQAAPWPCGLPSGPWPPSS